MSHSIEFSTWINHWSTELDLSESDIAAGINVRSITVRRWLLGMNQPKSIETVRRVVDFLQSRGATNVPIGFTQKKVSPLDDSSADQVLLVSYENPIIEREGAEIALRNILQEKKQVTYFLLHPNRIVLDLEFFPFIRSTVVKLMNAGQPKEDIANLLKIYIHRKESHKSFFQKVTETILSKSCLVANIDDRRNIVTSCIVHRSEGQESRILPGFEENIMDLSQSLIRNLMNSLDSNQEELIEADALSIAADPIGYLNTLLPDDNKCTTPREHSFNNTMIKAVEY